LISLSRLIAFRAVWTVSFMSRAGLKRKLETVKCDVRHFPDGDVF
jgi:hypothetical protein